LTLIDGKGRVFVSKLRKTFGKKRFPRNCAHGLEYRWIVDTPSLDVSLDHLLTPFTGIHVAYPMSNVPGPSSALLIGSIRFLVAELELHISRRPPCART